MCVAVTVTPFARYKCRNFFASLNSRNLFLGEFAELFFDTAHPRGQVLNVGGALVLLTTAPFLLSL